MKFTLLYSKTESDLDSIYLRHRYSIKGKRYEVKLKTPFKINPKHWDDENECFDLSFKTNSPRKAEHKILNSQIEDFNTEFLIFKKKIYEFIQNNPFPNREELFSLIYGDKILEKKKETKYPESFSKFVDFYILEKEKFIPGKQNPISTATKNRYNQIKTKVDKFYPDLKITEIDDAFRDEYSIFMNKLKYKQSYIIKELKFIKSFCKFANQKLDINKEVLFWTFTDTDKDTYEDPIFSFQELNIIKSKELDSERLDNARDWLLISCYTGQRVSDLLKMSSENIIDSEYYHIFQQKGQKSITIWLFPEVREILAKRNGEFPRKISSQKYNDYIKLVAQKCDIDQPMKGGIQKDNRKVTSIYPKWELITSHIGSRTFVSLFEQLLGKENIKTQTGHTTDKMVSLYNKTEDIKKASLVKNAYSIIEPEIKKLAGNQ